MAPILFTDNRPPPVQRHKWHHRLLTMATKTACLLLFPPFHTYNALPIIMVVMLLISFVVVVVAPPLLISP